MGKGAQVTDASQEREEQAMAKVVDVAAYVLQERGPMTAWKLQKLVYYCQAWSLVWEETALFEEPIEAWANGPVVRALYDLHKGEFQLKHLWNEDGEKVGEPDALNHVERETVDLVLDEGGTGPPAAEPCARRRALLPAHQRQAPDHRGPRWSRPEDPVVRPASRGSQDEAQERVGRTVSRPLGHLVVDPLVLDTPELAFVLPVQHRRIRLRSGASPVCAWPVRAGVWSRCRPGASPRAAAPP